MPTRRLALAATAVAALIALPAHAQTEIQWWHSMGGALGEWVNDLAKEFNASQTAYKVTPTFKGSYDESMTAAIAAFRAGNAPAILQVFEVGTATMMASKGAIKPVAEVMKQAGVNFDPKAYVPAVAGYYTAPNGQMLSFPFNSSTTVFHYNKDAFKNVYIQEVLADVPGADDVQGRRHQKPAPGWLRYCSSSGVEARPRMGLRCGKRPKRAITPRWRCA